MLTSHDIVFEVSTDTLLNTSQEKSVMDIEVIEDMFVAQVLAKSGSLLAVGQPVALLCDSLDDFTEAQNIKVTLPYPTL